MPRLDIRTLFSPTVLLALAPMTVIVMMILPMPAWVLDVGLATSFALAILIFTLTLFIERPLDFSAFPTILLASLMLRLSLNVSSTKLIIGQGHTGTNAAGDVIEGFAQFVMGGSIFLGLVVFGVLLIVNFMVITKGAARMAEVGARFALDGMPGKQLAIDSDMSAGAIDHQQAKERREREQQETTFFGSLDGASKFVKGDAVAGLLITLLNLVMGLIMGVIVHGMGQDVRISRVAVSQGNLTLTVEEAPIAVQPNPFARGETVVVPRTFAGIEEEEGTGLAEIPEATTLSEVVAGLNALGVSPRDMIDILKTIKAAGALHAEFVVR